MNNSLNINVSYGNPAQTSYVVTDLQGRVVMSRQLGLRQAEFTEKLDVSELTAGVYLIKVIKEDRSFTGKFVKN